MNYPQQTVGTLHHVAMQQKRGGAKGMKGGGPVKGIGGPTDDANLRALSKGEYVLPADTVIAMGGVKALDAIVAQTHQPVPPKTPLAQVAGAPMAAPPAASMVPGMADGGDPADILQARVMPLAASVGAPILTSSNPAQSVPVPTAAAATPIAPPMAPAAPAAAPVIGPSGNTLPMGSDYAGGANRPAMAPQLPQGALRGGSPGGNPAPKLTDAELLAKNPGASLEFAHGGRFVHNAPGMQRPAAEPGGVPQPAPPAQAAPEAQVNTGGRATALGAIAGINAPGLSLMQSPLRPKRTAGGYEGMAGGGAVVPQPLPVVPPVPPLMVPHAPPPAPTFWNALDSSAASMVPQKQPQPNATGGFTVAPNAAAPSALAATIPAQNPATAATLPKRTPGGYIGLKDGSPSDIEARQAAAEVAQRNEWNKMVEAQTKPQEAALFRPPVAPPGQGAALLQAPPAGAVSRSFEPPPAAAAPRAPAQAALTGGQPIETINYAAVPKEWQPTAEAAPAAARASPLAATAAPAVRQDTFFDRLRERSAGAAPAAPVVEPFPGTQGYTVSGERPAAPVAEPYPGTKGYTVHGDLPPASPNAGMRADAARAANALPEVVAPEAAAAAAPTSALGKVAGAASRTGAGLLRAVPYLGAGMEVANVADRMAQPGADKGQEIASGMGRYGAAMAASNLAGRVVPPLPGYGAVVRPAAMLAAGAAGYMGVDKLLPASGYTGISPQTPGNTGIVSADSVPASSLAQAAAAAAPGRGVPGAPGPQPAGYGNEGRGQGQAPVLVPPPAQPSVYGADDKFAFRDRIRGGAALDAPAGKGGTPGETINKDYGMGGPTINATADKNGVFNSFSQGPAGTGVRAEDTGAAASFAAQNQMRLANEATNNALYMAWRNGAGGASGPSEQDIQNAKLNYHGRGQFDESAMRSRQTPGAPAPIPNYAAQAASEQAAGTTAQRSHLAAVADQQNQAQARVMQPLQAEGQRQHVAAGAIDLNLKTRLDALGTKFAATTDNKERASLGHQIASLAGKPKPEDWTITERKGGDDPNDLTGTKKLLPRLYMHDKSGNGHWVDEAQAATAGPLPNHIDALQKKLVTPAQFDAKYGDGASKKYADLKG